MVGGVKKYRVEFFPKIKFKPFITDAKTKGDNLEFITPSVEVTIFENDNGYWKKHEIYASKSVVVLVLNSMFTQSTATLQIAV